MRSTPPIALHIPSSMHPKEMQRLALAMATSGVHTSPPLSLIEPDLLLRVADLPTVLWSVDNLDDAQLKEWAQIMLALGGSSFMAVAASKPNATLYSTLTGSGLFVASKGLGSKALTLRSTRDLRKELVESKAILGEAVGYEIKTLIPTPNPFGRAIDQLVLDEAARAGYRLILCPEEDLLAPWRKPHGLKVMTYHTVRDGENTQQLTALARSGPHSARAVWSTARAVCRRCTRLWKKSQKNALQKRNDDDEQDK